MPILVTDQTQRVEQSAPALSASDPRWSKGHIRVLDGLRGCAVLSVMAYHFLAPELSRPATGFARHIQNFFAVGWCGVDLFFVLSGFLITGILLDAKGHSKTYFESFYVRRILRIFPLYYGVILLVAIGRHSPAVSDFFGFGDVTASLGWMAAFLSNFVMSIRHNKNAFGPMGHFWSLAVEEHFYMIWPALVWLCTRRGLAIACVSFVVGAFLLRTGLAFHNHTTYATYLLSPCRVDGLAMGALMALIVRSHLSVDLVRKWAWTLGVPSLLLIIALGFRGGGSGGFSHYGRAMTTGGFSLFAILFASVIALVVSAPPNAGGRVFLEWAPLRSVGRYSFAMYIFHLLCLRPFTLLFPIKGLGHMLHSTNLGIFAFAILASLATYGLAMLSWYCYEQNFLRLKRLFPY
ncbi:MAG TPA: acyltransferase [Tepidisphaeraceae bacterium]|jgi:peptidoglycan/LPS O-acetylase OafA/YrhL|nr:acyltransferase [Tepidisphaeraceae bacterium]